MQLILLFLYISSVFSYKILVFSPTYSRSHMISNGRYADELAKAGHDVVLFEPDWVHIFDHEDFKSAEIAWRLIMKGFPNDILEVVSGFSTDVFADDSIYEISMIQLRYFEVQDRLCRQILDNDEIMNKLREEKFDAFFGEQVHLCGNGIAHVLGIKSHFWIQSCPVYEYTNWWLGQPTPLSYIPAHGIDVDPNLGYIQRAHSAFYGAVNFLVGWYVHTGTTNMFREKYGPDFPHVGHIASDSDIVFVSTDEFIDMPRPILPNMINVGGLGVQETSNKPLGEEFEKEMQKGKKGIIYFSVGTIANTTKLPEIIGAVVTLAKNFPDYHILAKAQPGDVHSKKIADSVPNLSVHFWIPQVAVLLHPRLKLFITHAGYNGIMEAARAGIPLITMPFMFDQAKNSRTVQMSGWGIHVPRQSIKYDHQKIVTAVKEILENDKFKKNALRIQKLIHEKPFNASERLVKTVEFVLNNGGVKELLTAGRRMSIVHLYNLDILVPFAILLIAVPVFSIKIFIRVILNKEKVVKQKIN